MAEEVMTLEESVRQYDLIVSKIPEIERKGKGSPYTSMNGNMYTMMRKDGALGIRLSKEDRELFMELHLAQPFENYGSMIKEYVEVPNHVFMDLELMVIYLKKSHDYAKTLKAKPTKKASQKTSEKSPKKLTHDLGTSFKNGQLKAEIVDGQMIQYFEDGSIKAKGAIIDEAMHGPWIFNRKGGQLLQVGHYDLGVKNGEWIRYDSNNQVAYHVVFTKGKVSEQLL